MGILDWLFGKKETNSEPEQKNFDVSNDFIEWEEFSITDEQTKNLLNVYSESLGIVRTSKDIATVDSRFGILLDTVEKLLAMKNPEVNFFLREFQNLDINKVFDSAVKKFIEKQVQEILKLKTEKGRKNRLEKVFAIIDGLEYLSDDSKIYAKKILRTRLKMNIEK